MVNEGASVALPKFKMPFEAAMPPLSEGEVPLPPSVHVPEPDLADDEAKTAVIGEGRLHVIPTRARTAQGKRIDCAGAGVEMAPVVISAPLLATMLTPGRCARGDRPGRRSPTSRCC